MVNPFKGPAMEGLTSITTGVRASSDTQKDLTQVKQVVEKALKTCLEKGGDKLSVQLNTSEMTQSKNSTGKEQCKPRPEIISSSKFLR